MNEIPKCMVQNQEDLTIVSKAPDFGEKGHSRRTLLDCSSTLFKIFFAYGIIW